MCASGCVLPGRTKFTDSGAGSDSRRAVALVEDAAREGVRGPRRGERPQTDLDSESRSDFGAQPREPQLHASTQSVCRYGENCARL